MSTCKGCCKNREEKKECKGCGCDGSCDCDEKLKRAREEAEKKDGVFCKLCGTWASMCRPNWCNGDFYCDSCKRTRAYLLPKKGKPVKQYP